MKRNTVRGWGSRKRRIGIVAGVALVVAVVAPLVAPSAGAVVTNAGNLEVQMRLSVFTPTFTVAGVASNGTGTATLQKDGLVKIPQSSISFLPITVQIALPSTTTSSTDAGASSAADPTQQGAAAPAADQTITVQTVATSEFTGGINPKNGAAFLVGNIEEVFTQSGTIDNCVVGPFRIAAGTSTAGGVPYSVDNGSVTVVDPNYEIDAVSTGASGCDGYEGALNTALSLPVTTTTTTTLPPGSPATTPTTGPLSNVAPVPSIVVSLTFTPAPHEAIAPPPTQGSPRPTVGTQVSSITSPPTVAPGSGNGNGPNPQPSVHRRKPDKPKTNPNKLHHKAGNPNKKAHPGGNPNKVNHAPKKKTSKKHKTAATGSYLPGGSVKSSGAAAPKAKRAAKGSAAKGPSGRELSFITASFVKPSPSALSTGLDLAGLLGLLVFSSLALWLVTSEISAFSANARRQRTHRIAGITARR